LYITQHADRDHGVQSITLYVLASECKIVHNTNKILVRGDKMQGQYGYAWMHESVHACHDAEHGKANPCDEFKRYLESSLEDGVVNVIRYWGVYLPHDILVTSTDTVLEEL
jgi:hypothetical protein